MMDRLTLLPHPRQTDLEQGHYSPRSNTAIFIIADDPQKVLFGAEQLADSVQNHWGISLPIKASRSLPTTQQNVTIIMDEHAISQPQGYRIEIRPDHIKLSGSDFPGIFYGIQTLMQLVMQSPDKQLPCCQIHDWPDYLNRGVMLDISRDKVYTMETLRMLVDVLASWKINQLQLYIEHTFAYQGHETVWKDASPMTPEDILRLDRYCKERFIELVPNQNSLGHMSRWLKHPSYKNLAETTKSLQTPWGTIQEQPFSLAPTLAETIDFIKGLYDQLLPNFSSNQLNVGCDEAFDIGAGKSAVAVKEKGKGQIYLDFLLALHRDLTRRGIKMQYWGDIILEHPDLIPQLPDDAIALDWGYEADHPFDKETRKFKDSGIPFYVCPGTSSWNSLAGRVHNMLENCKTAAQAGLQNGAVGYLNTDWGDNGHWQQLPISYPGLAAGAAFSWCLSSNRSLNLEKVLNDLVFLDTAKIIGRLLITIGDEYRRWGMNIPNSSPLFWLLQEKTEVLQRFAFDDLSPIHSGLSRLTGCLDQLNFIQLQRSDARVIRNELALTIKLMIHACKRALLIYETGKKPNPLDLLHEIDMLKVDFQAVWLKRNRIGGMMDSISKFNILLDEYQEPHE